MTSYMMDLILLEQFYIITHPKIDLVISYLIYLIFQIYFLNEPFQSTYAINLLIALVVSLACNTSLFQINVYM